MTKESPYEYYQGRLGIKIKFLIADRNKAADSLCLINYRAFRKRMDSSTSSEKELRRASLGCDALVQFNSLSREWRDLITVTFGEPETEVKKSWFAQNYVADPMALDFFQNYRYGEANEKKLPPDAIDTYTYNASVLNTVLKMKANRKQYLKAIGCTTVDIWESLSKDVNAFKEVPHDLPTTRDSLRHKVNRYAKEKYKSVISGRYGLKNYQKVKTKEQKALLEELLAKHQNLNNEQIATIYNTIAESMQWPSISAGTVANQRKALDLYIYAGSKGIKEFAHNRNMQVKRSGPSLPMVYWTLDGWDVELMFQKKEPNKNGYNVTTYHNRPNAVVVLDPFNKYPIGYAIGNDESPALIREALRNAVNHTKELFGQRYKPYQLQSDNYQLKNLRPTYENMTKIFTPAAVGNSKSKVIENYFDKYNEKYFQGGLAINWSGHNIDSRKENQPNREFSDKVKKLFPDYDGCKMQIIQAIEAERAEKRNEYMRNWYNLPDEDKLPMTQNEYLRLWGEYTGYTNKMRGNGLTPTINGEVRYFDTFNLKFREYFHTDWMVRYDPQDLSQILVTNAQSRDGKLIKEIGTVEFILDQKYIQPMALYDRQDGDAEKLQEVFDYNKQLEKVVIERNAERYQTIQELVTNNKEVETLQKLMITDSRGQHKEQKQKAKQKERTLPVIQPVAEEYEIIEETRRYY